MLARIDRENRTRKPSGLVVMESERRRPPLARATPRSPAMLPFRVALIFFLTTLGARAQLLEGPALERAGVTLTHEQIAGGEVSLQEIRRQGRLVFSTPFN
jgi:hypothetical protein